MKEILQKINLVADTDVVVTFINEVKKVRIYNRSVNDVLFSFSGSIGENEGMTIPSDTYLVFAIDDLCINGSNTLCFKGTETLENGVELQVLRWD